jgi:hypothetical protein
MQAPVLKVSKIRWQSAKSEDEPFKQTACQLFFSLKSTFISKIFAFHPSRTRLGCQMLGIWR